MKGLSSILLVVLIVVILVIGVIVYIQIQAKGVIQKSTTPTITPEITSKAGDSVEIVYPSITLQNIQTFDYQKYGMEIIRFNPKVHVTYIPSGDTELSNRFNSDFYKPWEQTKGNLLYAFDVSFHLSCKNEDFSFVIGYSKLTNIPRDETKSMEKLNELKSISCSEVAPRTVTIRLLSFKHIPQTAVDYLKNNYDLESVDNYPTSSIGPLHKVTTILFSRDKTLIAVSEHDGGSADNLDAFKRTYSDSSGYKGGYYASKGGFIKKCSQDSFIEIGVSSKDILDSLLEKINC